MRKTIHKHELFQSTNLNSDVEDRRISELLKNSVIEATEEGRF